MNYVKIKWTWDTNKQEKRKDALGLFYESVLKPDA